MGSRSKRTVHDTYLPPDKLNKNSNNEEDELKTIDFIETRQQDFSPKITWKHLWTFNEAENALLKSPFINMPTEMMLKIFELLSVRDLENISLVCRYFKMIVDHDIIWKTRCNISKKINTKAYKRIYIDWMFEKYLRNQELKILEKQYQKMNIGFGLKYSSSRTIQLSVNIDKTVYVLILLLEKASKFQNKWHDCLRLFHQIIDHSLLLDHTQQSFKEQAFLDTLHLYEKHFHEQYCSLSLYKNDKISSSKYIHPHFDRFQCLIPIYSYWDKTYFKFSSYSLNDYENPFSFTEADIILDANFL
ncbi:unnamed protein product [Rotaria sordida]|uniref:F-box domain-containing protein n=1 Tax=Rotaria sordida TaxID=392033 RepID=A0A819K4E3_9BILA|nr:unnamed protein product [Rotaria sordida]